MTDKEMSKAAAQFAKDWADASYEKGQAQPFWIALLRTVFGVEYPEKYISFEEKVKYTKTHYADGFIDTSRVLIEQKSGDVDLGKKYTHGERMLRLELTKLSVAEKVMKCKEEADFDVVFNDEGFFEEN